MAAAAVVAVRAALAAGPAWTPRLAAGVLAFGVLRWGWRAAASVDRLRRRRSSRRRAERVWRAIDRHGIEVPTLAVGRLVAEWGAAAGRLLPVSLAGEARIVFGGLVLVLAYLLWTR